MYTTAWEARRLTLLEWAFVYLCILFASLSITFGCYFTFMTRHGKHRMFLERIEEMEEECSDDESEATETSSTDLAKTTLTLASSTAQLLDMALRSSQTRTSQTRTSSSVGRATLTSPAASSAANLSSTATS